MDFRSKETNILTGENTRVIQKIIVQNTNEKSVSSKRRTLATEVILTTKVECNSVGWVGIKQMPYYWR